MAPPLTLMCVHFLINGPYRITALVFGKLSTATELGHFTLLVNSSALLAPAPAPTMSLGGPSPTGPPPSPMITPKEGRKKGESKVDGSGGGRR